MSFPLKFYSIKSKCNIQEEKNWVTQGIRISSSKTQELNQLAKQSEDPDFIN